MIEIETITKRTNLGYKNVLLSKKYQYKVHEAYRLDDDHVLFVEVSYETKTYCVCNMKGVVTLVLSTFVEKHCEKINIVEAYSKNKYSAVKLYKFLIKTLGKTLVTEQQSLGGMFLWQKLSRVKGITINGYDFKKNRLVNTDKYLKDVDDIYVTRGLSSKHKDISNINLVAWSK